MAHRIEHASPVHVQYRADFTVLVRMFLNWGSGELHGAYFNHALRLGLRVNDYHLRRILHIHIEWLAHAVIGLWIANHRAIECLASIDAAGSSWQKASSTLVQPTIWSRRSLKLSLPSYCWSICRRLMSAYVRRTIEMICWAPLSYCTLIDAVRVETSNQPLLIVVLLVCLDIYWRKCVRHWTLVS